MNLDPQKYEIKPQTLLLHPLFYGVLAKKM